MGREAEGAARGAEGEGADMVPRFAEVAARISPSVLRVEGGYAEIESSVDRVLAEAEDRRKALAS